MLAALRERILKRMSPTEVTATSTLRSTLFRKVSQVHEARRKVFVPGVTLTTTSAIFNCHNNETIPSALAVTRKMSQVLQDAYC